MFTNIERTGFLTVQDLAKALIADINSGMTVKAPNALTGNEIAATFESKASCDPLHVTQAWRLRVEADASAQKLMVFAATAFQLPDDGTVTLSDDGFGKAGEMGSHPLPSQGASGDQNTYFINRAHYQGNQSSTYPMSYSLTFGPNGVSLFIWEAGMDSLGVNYSWFNVQRPVHNTSGAALTTGKSPVFCVYAINRDATNFAPTGVNDNSVTLDTDVIRRFTVREADVLRPFGVVDATLDSENATRFINKEAMVSITEDGKYVLTFPNGLNTTRYAYPAYELDMIAYSSSDVISQSSAAEITVYGEAQPRQYRAMQANQSFNNGMRMFQAVSGGN